MPAAVRSVSLPPPNCFCCSRNAAAFGLAAVCCVMPIPLSTCLSVCSCQEARKHLRRVAQSEVPPRVVRPPQRTQNTKKQLHLNSGVEVVSASAHVPYSGASPIQAKNLQWPAIDYELAELYVSKTNRTAIPPRSQPDKFRRASFQGTFYVLVTGQCLQSSTCRPNLRMTSVPMVMVIFGALQVMQLMLLSALLLFSVLTQGVMCTR